MRPTLFAIGLACSLMITAPAATAQNIVMGTDLAAKCYQSVELETNSAKRAEKICTQALKMAALTPRNKAAVHINRGIARMRQNKAELALEDFVEAKRFRPNEPDLYINEGAVLVHMGRFEDALTSLTKAVEYESDNLHIAYLNLGLAREGLGDYAGAYFDIARAKELAPDWVVAQKEFARFRVFSE